MTGRSASGTGRKRWQRSIIRHLEELPRQYAALENAMAAFGDDFDLKQFKAAFNTTEDMDAYNRVQALERAMARVQNFVAELAEAGVMLAQLPLPSAKPDGSPAIRTFESLRDVGVIDGGLCRRLSRAQKARSRVEHSYVQTPAGDVHGAARLIQEAARDFIGRYRDWIEPHLEQGGVE